MKNFAFGAVSALATSLVTAFALLGSPTAHAAAMQSAGCAAGANHVNATSTSVQIGTAIGTAIGGGALVTVDATGMTADNLGTLGQNGDYLAGDGVFGNLVLNSGLYTGASTTALATRLEGLLLHTCETAFVTVNAAGFNTAALQVVCDNIAKVDVVTNLPADKTLTLSAAQVSGKLISGPGTVAINATELTGSADLLGITTANLTFPAAAPFFSIGSGGVLSIYPERASGWTMQGTGTVSLVGTVDFDVDVSDISATVSLDADGTTGTVVATGKTFTLTAAQADGETITGAGTTAIDGNVAANANFTLIATLLNIPGSVDDPATLTLTAAQGDGRTLGGTGSIAITTAALTANTDFRGLTTAGFSFTGTIGSGATLSINAAQDNITVSGEGTVDILGTAGIDAVAAANISATRVISTLAGADSLTGGSTNDTLDGGADDDSIDGGAGFDSAVYAGASTGAVSGSATITVTTASDGTDSLTNVERLVFNDATVAVIGRAGSAYTTLNQVLALGGSEKLYGTFTVDSNSFTNAAALDALIARFVDGSGITVDVLGMNAAQLAAVDTNAASFAPIAYPPVQVVSGGAPSGYFNTIQAAINFATAGDIVNVGAGTYAEFITISKALDVRGPNWNVSPNGGTRVAEAVIVPPSSDPANGNIVTVSASGVSVRGFTIDGDNTSLADAGATDPAFPDASIDAIRGIFCSVNGLSNTLVEHNIVRSVLFSAIRLEQTTNQFPTNALPGNFSVNNLVTDNLCVDCNIGVDIRNSGFAGVTDNTVTNARYGVYFGSCRIANTSNAAYRVVSGNTLAVRQWGMWFNLYRATPYTVSDNTITAVAEASRTEWFGVMLANVAMLQNFVNQNLLPQVAEPEYFVFSNNSIDASGADEATATFGYWGWALDNGRDALSVDHFTQITGGSVSNVDYGVMLRNVATAGTGAGADSAFGTASTGAHASVSGVAFGVNAGGTGFRLEDDASWTSSNPAPLVGKRTVELTVGAGNTISGGTTGLSATQPSTETYAMITGGTLSDLAMTGQTGDYIALGTSNGLNATGSSFGGVNGASATLAQLYAVEDKITDKLDDTALGLVRVKSANVYVTATGNIGRGVTAADAGDTVNVQAGTYTENISIGKRIALVGAGSGASGTALVSAAGAGTPVISVTGSGLDADNQLVIRSVSTNGPGGSGGSDAIAVYGDTPVSFVKVDDVVVTNHGVAVHYRTGTISNATVSNSTMTGNGNAVRVATAVTTMDGMTIDGCTVSESKSSAITTNPSGTLTNVNTNFVVSNSTFTNNSVAGVANQHDLSFFGFHGNATLSNVTVTSGNGTAANSNSYGIVFTNASAYDAAGTISLSNVTVQGHVGKGALSFQLYSDLGGVSLSSVSLQNCVAPWGDLIVDSTDADAMNAGNTSLKSIVLWNAGGVDATGVSFYSAAGSLLDRTVLADAFQIADQVGDAVDLTGLGYVNFRTGHVYVTPASFDPRFNTAQGALERAIAVASPGDEIHVKDGTETYLTAEITKSVTFSGTFAITSTSIPTGATAQTVLESFLTRLSAGSTVSANLAGMDANQVAAVNANFAAFASFSGNPIAVVRGGADIGYFTVIQQAIDFATAGDIVNIAAGTYQELLSIEKSLILRGPNAGVAGNGTRAPEATVTYPAVIGAGEVLVYVAANDVTIEGLNLRAEDDIASLYPYPILTQSANDLTIRNNRIYGGEIAMYILTTNGTTDTAGFREGMLVEGNFVDCGPFVNSSYNRGIYVQATAGTIQDNHFVNTQIGIQYMPYGHALQGLIRRNTVSASLIGLYHNFQIAGAGLVSWEDNTVTVAANDRAGAKATVDGAYTAPVTFRGIALRSFGLPGYTGTVPSVSFTGNSIDASTGAEGYNSTVLEAVRFGATGGVDQISSGTATFSGNSFTNWTDGVNDAYGASYEMSCNWWGTADADALAAAIPGTLRYSPYASSAVDESCTGVGAVVLVDKGRSYATITAALDASATVGGDTLEVAAGTYNESILVTKSVALRGANAGVSGTAARGAESSIAVTGDWAVQIGAANVSVDGFSISNTAGSAVRVMGAEAADGDVSGASIANNVISGVAIGTGSGSDVSGVINLGLGSGHVANGFSVTNNLIAATGTIAGGNGAIGVRIGDTAGTLSGTVTVSGNRITGPGSAVANASGVYMNTNAAAITVSNNEIGDFFFALRPTGSSNPTIAGNTFKVGEAVNGYDVLLQGTSGYTLGANAYWGSTLAIFAGTPNLGADISATGSSFRGVTLDGESTSLAQLFAIEDQIAHKVDKVSRGFVRTKTGEVFVSIAAMNGAAALATPENALYNAIEAAADNDIIRVETGAAITLTTAITKPVTFSGTFAINASNIPTDATATAVLSSFMNRVGTSTVSVDLAGMNANQVAAVNANFAAFASFSGNPIAVVRSGADIGYFTAIQQAIDFASAGDTVNVGAGTYAVTSAVTVDKAISLRGAQFGVDARTRNGAESIIDASGTSGVSAAGVVVSAGVVGATVDGFTVTGVPSSGLAGIYLGIGSSGTTVSNNIVTANRYGIMPNSGDADAPTVIERNLFTSNTNTGVYVDDSTVGGAFDGLVIRDNRFTNATAQSQFAIVIDNEGTTLLSGATISGNAFDANTLGIMLVGLSDSTISGNTFTGDYAIEMYDGLLPDVPANTNLAITGNTFTSPSSAIRIADFGFGAYSGTLAPSGNTFTDCTNAIVNAGAPAVVTAFGNTFDGVLLDGATTLDDIYTIAGLTVDSVDDGTYGDVVLRAGNVFVTSSNTIARGIAVATTGDTVNVQAGTYGENIVVDKRITLDGAIGVDGEPTTIVSSSTGNTPVANITASGLDASNRLVLRDLVLTGATGSGNSASGILLTQGTAQGYMTFDNLDIQSNQGEGIAFNNTVSITDIVISGCDIASSGNSGIRIATAVPSFIGLSVRDTTVSASQNAGFMYNPSGNVANIGTGFTFTNCQFTNNNLAGTNNSHDMAFMRFTGAATLTNVTVTSAQPGTTAGGYSIVFYGKGYDSPCGAVSLDGVTCNGTVVKGGLAFMVYSDLANVSMNGVDVSGLTAPWGQLIVDHTSTTSVLNAGDTVAKTLVHWNTGGTDARGMTFKSAVDGATLVATTLADGFQIENQIAHKIDSAVLGLARVLDGHLWVTALSGTVENAIAASSAGDIIHIENGVAITLTQAVTADVTFSGNLVITSTSFPNDATGQTILESFLSRVSTTDGSTVTVNMAGMNATQIAAVNALSSYFTGGLFPVQVVREGASVGGYATINEAIAAEATVAGDTLLLKAGTYAENIVLSKGVTIQGADKATTILTATTGDIVAVSGTGATLRDLTVSGAAPVNGVGFDAVASTFAMNNVAISGLNYGVKVGTGTVSGMTLASVDISGCSVGFHVSTAGKVSTLAVTGGSMSGNGYGFYSSADVARSDNHLDLTGVTVTGTQFNNNQYRGLYLEKLNAATFTDVVANGNGNPSPAVPSAQFSAGFTINLKYGSYQDISINNLAMNLNGLLAGEQGNGLIVQVRNDNDAATGGLDYSANPASLSGLTINGGSIANSPKCLTIAGGVDLSTVSVSGITLDGAAGGIGLMTYGSLPGQITLTDVTFGSGLTAYITNLTQGTVIDANDATFGGVRGGDATVAQGYAIADKLFDIVDSYVGAPLYTAGTTIVQTGHVWVTNLSFYAPAGTTAPSIERGVLAAFAGDTIHVENGVAVTLSAPIAKSVTFDGAFTVTATSIPTDSTATATLASFTSRLGTSTLSVDVDGMNAAQVAAVASDIATITVARVANPVSALNAADAAGMDDAFTVSGITPDAAYTALDLGRQLAVRNDMVSNRDSGFASVEVADTLFNKLVTFRTAVEAVVDGANANPGNITAADFSSGGRMVAVYDAMVALGGATLNGEAIDTAGALAAINAFNALNAGGQATMLATINAGGYTSFTQLAVASQTVYPTAVLDNLNAADATNIVSALEVALILPDAAYTALDAGRQLAVQADMLANRGAGFLSVPAADELFNQLVSFRTAVEAVVDGANANPGNIVAADFSSGGRMYSVYENLVTLDGKSLSGEPVDAAAALAAIDAFNVLNDGGRAVILATINAGGYTSFTQLAVASQAAYPAAVLANLNAADATNIVSALEVALILPDTPYTALDAGRQLAVQADMLANRGTGFASVPAADTLFNQLVSFRTAVQVVVNGANAGNIVADDFSSGGRMYSVYENLVILDGKSLSGEPVDAAAALAAIDAFNVLNDGGRAVILATINAGGYTSFSQIALASQAAYPAAVLANLNAADATNIVSALEVALILPDAAYTALDAGRQLAVQADMLANRGTGFLSVAAADELFNLLVTFRTAVEAVVDGANANPGNITADDFSAGGRMVAVYDAMVALGGATLNGEPIDAAGAAAAIASFNALGADGQAVILGTINAGGFTSFTQLAAAAAAAYDNAVARDLIAAGLSSSNSVAEIQLAFTYALDNEVLVDAAGMDADQLGAISTGIAKVDTISNLTLRSTESVAEIGNLLSKTSGALVIATDMSVEQLSAVAAGYLSVADAGVTGTFTVEAAITNLANLLARTSLDATVTLNLAGMSPEYIALVNGNLGLFDVVIGAPVSIVRGTAIVGYQLGIQAGIDYAVAGDTVNVAAGTYSEQFTIAKDITVQGPNAGVAGNGTRADEAILDYSSVAVSGGQHILVSEGALKGFRVVDNNIPVAGDASPRIAVRLASATSASVTDTVFFRDSGYDAPPGDPQRNTDIRAIHVDQTADGSVSIASNLFTGSATGLFSNQSWHRGVWTQGVGAAVAVTGNEFGNVRSPLNAHDDMSMLVVDGNAFNGVGVTGISFGNSGGAGFETAATISSSFTLGANSFVNTGTIFNLSNVPAGFTLDATASSFNGTAFSAMTVEQHLEVAVRSVQYITNAAKNGLVISKAGNVYVPGSGASLTGGIGRAITVASVGNTVNVAAGTFTGNVNVSKRIALVGAGATTVVTPSTAGTAVITVSASGASATERLTVSDLTASGGTGGGNSGSGIYVAGSGEINHLTISGVTVTGNTGFGIAFNNTFDTSDVEILNSTISSNTDVGIRIASATPNFTGLLVDGCTVSNNGTFGFASNQSQTNANINTGFVFQNSSFTGNNTAGGANNHVMFFGAFSGTATISNVDITANTRAHGIVFNGSGSGTDLATWPAASAIVMNDVVFGGTLDKTCTYFYRYSTLANVSMTDVDMSAVTTLPNWHQLSADTNGVLDAGNTKLTTISSGGCAIDARDVTFYGTGGAIDKTVLANLYRIEDAIRHQVDTGVPGLVRVNDASVYVSVNSGTIENAVAAASADDVIYVEAGVPVVLTQEITKSVSFVGDFVILSTSFPNDTTGQAILESFLSRGVTGQSTFSAVTTGMTADQLNAIGSLSTYFNGGVTGDLTLTSAQSAAQITSLLAGAANGSVYAVATGMGDDQLNAVAANAVKIAADGISGTMIVTSAIADANLGALLGKASVADAIVEINASGMTDGELSTVVLAGDRVDEAYNLALDNGQTDSEITALLAKSVASASTGKAMAVADATDMDAAKLNALGASYAKLASDGITGSVLVTGGSLGVTDANLTNLFVKIADAADVRIDGTDMGASTLTILSSNITLVDSAFDLAFTSAQSVAELSNLLDVSDVASATADATGMDSAAGGQLATLADNYTKFADNGITGTVSITSGLTFQQITNLLSKVDLTGASFVAGTTVLIDAAGMSDAQLTSVVNAVTTAGTPANQATVFDVINLTLTQNQSSEQMATLLNVTLDNEATVDATGMDSTQLAELGNYSDSVETITGSVTITADLSAAQIAAIMGNTSTEADVTIDSNGMSPEQQAAVFSTAIVSVEANATVATGDTFFVDVNISGLPRQAVGLQARIAYDPAFVEFVADFDEDTFTDPVGGTDFPQTVYVTQGASFVTFATGVDIGGDGTGITSGNAARLRFRAIAPYCNQTGLVWLATTGFTNQASDTNATAIPFTGTNFSNVTSLNNLQLAGVPAADTTVPADAGTVLGAVIAEPTVTAANNCTSVPVTFSITYPDLTTGSTWPTYFPVGVSTIEWTTTDAGGNVDSAIRLYTVENYQLATIDVNLVGGVNPSLQFNQDVRIRLSSGDVVTATVAFTGNNGAVTDVQIPVRDDYTCITVKDAAHTLANARTLSVSGTKWVADTTFELIAGDSNDDNVVDILDFGVFVSDRGAGKNPASRSNFNRDAFVNNADFTFIALNFLDIGDSCGAFNGGQPLDRISVKDLRRMGLGHLEEADINMDGWVDATDIALAMQGQYRKDYAERLHPSLEVDMPQW